MSDTVLTLSGIGIVPFSARGVSETRRPIDQARQQRRTVNGALVDLSTTAFRKYALSLSGGDLQPMALNGVWQGQAVTVGCISELGQAVTLTAGVGSVSLDRKPVTGSGRAIFETGAEIYRLKSSGVVFSQNTAGDWSAAVNFSNAGLAGMAFVFYRPELNCMVSGFNSEADEWAATNSWTMDLEEV